MRILSRLLRLPDGADSAGTLPADNPAPEIAPPPPESPGIVEKQSRRGVKTAREIELERRLSELEDENQNLKTVLTAGPVPEAPKPRRARSITDEVAAYLEGED